VGIKREAAVNRSIKYMTNIQPPPDNVIEKEEKPLLSVVLPCLNEEEALPTCIEKIRAVFSRSNINGEIVVSDNGSTDDSVNIARRMGVQLVQQPLRGYGNAYKMGFTHARGKYFIMADADDTYDFNLIPLFLDKLVNEKCEFVTGSRYTGGGGHEIKFLHRYVGNPMLTLLLNVLFGTTYTDVYCGFRGFSREAYERIAPVSPGMEFNLELAINAHLAKLKSAEIPITLAPRIGESKLSTFKDGWRSLRMMLLYCPNKVFLVPGSLLFLCGVLLQTIVIFKLLNFHGEALGIVTSLTGAMLCVIGFQIMSLGLHAKTYSWSRRFDVDNRVLLSFYSIFNLELGMLVGIFMLLSGMLLWSYLIACWIWSDLRPLAHPEYAAFAATLTILGCNVIFTSLFISAMSITKTEDHSLPIR